MNLSKIESVWFEGMTWGAIFSLLGGAAFRDYQDPVKWIIYGSLVAIAVIRLRIRKSQFKSANVSANAKEGCE